MPCHGFDFFVNSVTHVETDTECEYLEDLEDLRQRRLRRLRIAFRVLARFRPILKRNNIPAACSPPTDAQSDALSRSMGESVGCSSVIAAAAMASLSHEVQIVQ